MKGKRSIAAVIAAVIGFQLLTGCGKQAEAVNEKEFISADGTYSVWADENYVLTDVGLDSWMDLGMPGSTDGILIMQLLPDSRSISMGNWESLDAVREYMEEANQLYDRQEADKPENPIFHRMEAYTYQTTQEGHVGKMYTVYGETDYAYYAISLIESGSGQDDNEFFKNICASFKEIEEGIEAKEASIAETPDTIRWFNASNALLVGLNNFDYRLFGGLVPNSINREVAKNNLNNAFGVTDKFSANETLQWLLSEGERADFKELMEYLEEAGLHEIEKEERTDFMLENFEVSEEEAENYAEWYNKYEEDSEDAVSGWDYNRALSQIANFYLAGYYTLEEAYDASLDAAVIVQERFDSWDDYMESYFTGYEYWGGESSEDRREVYRSLQSAEDNPYQIDFHTKLEKSW